MIFALFPPASWWRSAAALRVARYECESTPENSERMIFIVSILKNDILYMAVDDVQQYGRRITNIESANPVLMRANCSFMRVEVRKSIWIRAKYICNYLRYPND